jgi:GNAT superfamily N-acetyltransferase
MGMAEPSNIDIRPIEFEDRAWIEDFYTHRWGSCRVVTRSKLHVVSELPGFIAWIDGTKSGLLTYHHKDEEVEIVTLDSLEPGQGVGSALISAAAEYAREIKSRRLWLITTNDNTHALRFYQRQGFSLVKIHKDALQVSRTIKPEIPLVGLDGIPLRDEIELEMQLI